MYVFSSGLLRLKNLRTNFLLYIEYHSDVFKFFSCDLIAEEVTIWVVEFILIFYVVMKFNLDLAFEMFKNMRERLVSATNFEKGYLE